MNPDTPPGLDPQLLDDFFVEADEHLEGIRQALLRLEASVSKAEPDLKIVKELFQDFHSFKGISAIVGLRPAEAVAHTTEDFLRLMRDGKAQLTNSGLQVLTAATQKLEQVVSAFRSRKPMPGHESLLRDLEAQCEQWSAAGPAPITTDGATVAPAYPSISTDIEDAKAHGRLLWQFTFSPSKLLDAQGINVNSVRERLSKLGEILNTTPTVKRKDLLVFEFLVSTQETPTDLSSWEAMGITIESAESEKEESSSAGAPAIEEADHNPFLAPSHIVRVDLKRLDDLMRITGELVIHRSRLNTRLNQLDGDSRRGDLSGVLEVSNGLGRSLKELREAIMRVRLIPVAEIFARMPFVVRDLARQTKKQVRLKLTGQETAIDKYLIERLKDPLLHLVRNAFSHGVETPAERVAASKPEEATIELNASTVGDSVIIEVRDDGRGINPNAIIQRAGKMGLEIPEVTDNETILKILCSSGFSTRENADLASGRGVGMGVVHATVRELGGHLTLNSEEGQGTRFTIRLPLTLAITDTFIVRASGQTCAVPQGFVREILQKTEAEIQIANGVEIIPYREGVLPVIRLSDFFRLPRITRKGKSYLLVIVSDRGSIGLLTDEVVGQREVVVRAFSDPLIQVPGVSGATELGDGKPVLILDGAALTSGTIRPLERNPMNN